MCILIGYDLDGCIGEYIEFSTIKGSKFFYKYFPKLFLKYVRGRMKVVWRPEGEFVIVTARNEDFRKVTEKWLKKNGIKYVHLYMYPGLYNDKTVLMTEWKSYIINKYELAEYYDDDIRYLDKIRENNKDIELIHIERNKGRGVRVR